MILIIRKKYETVQIPAPQVESVTIAGGGFTVRTSAETYVSNQVAWQQTVPAHNLMGVLAYGCYEEDGTTEVCIDRSTVQGITIENEPIMRTGNPLPGEVTEFIIPRSTDQEVLGVLDTNTGSRSGMDGSELQDHLSA